jgi:uncharacterized membrane protein
MLMIGLVLLIGLVLRFANLAAKPVWIDEAFSLMHVSGFNERATLTVLREAGPVSVATLRQYQMPYAQHSLFNTIDNIAKTAPELPPLYFVLLNLWMQVFGPGIVAIRSLSAVLSLACFPALYWLCVELFGVPIVGWYAMALFAVSPFHFLMAQEARPYTLWTLCFLIASSALLRAQRTRSPKDWGIHTIAMVLAMYTHLFSLLIWLIYTAYILVSERGRWTVTVRQYCVANISWLLAFTPWIWFGFIRPNDPDYKAFVRPYNSPIGLIKGLTRGIALFFVDFNLNEASPKLAFFAYLGLIGAVLGLSFYGLRYLLRRSRYRSRWFIGITALLPVALFVSSDLVLNASRTTMTRYFIPSVIAIQVAIAYMIASKQTFRFQSSQLWSRWQNRLMALFLVGSLSCTGFLLSPTWWSKDKTEADVCIAQLTSRLDQPLLVTDAYYVRALALSHKLKSSVRFQFLSEHPVAAPSLPVASEPTFLYMPSMPLQRLMVERYNLKTACVPHLWQVVSTR